ncbi:isoleucine--tRNA ligase [Nakamurella flavida]|uniref:Isoleucine--tRNA ligase n=1 Tax=Nakamurella flavida TaxID=363630 RepID=A0A938YH03_9ACTN|nr:isoleucine--tRNA ligase [Nakamurella flavida]MBM9477516.1 isoleucine--tRNA ligase [Nakamurella flavida]MDP9777449.1 isoleucyl-tRNA synthetase [Nakamurella flavida]
MSDDTTPTTGATTTVGASVYPAPGTTGTSRVDAHPDFPAVERDVLSYWAADDTFQASVDQRPAGEDGSNEFVFYDGPPFANGLPHYGHLLTGYVKDLVPRYQTMRGRRVERRFGWDTHGLPAEVEAERQLGIKHKAEIESMGIEQFNDACRTSVLRYTHEWQEYVTRQARWVDFTHDYKTLDLDYMESVMWAFKTLWDKGLIYEGYRVLWYCWRCETPLSATETKMDDTYRSRQDPAVTVALRLTSADPVLDGVSALIWTTTPWTVPSNLAAAVNPDVDYVVVEPAAEAPSQGRFLLAAARVAAYARELGEEPTVLATYTGAQLVGTRYRPPFDFFVATPDGPGLGGPNAHQILAADYVTTEDGTGVVHIAPAFGEEDKAVTDAAGIDVVNPVDARGTFTSLVPTYEGLQVFEANVPIMADLREAGLLVRRETYEHPYPHCWRCDTPLIQRAVSSWFVAVTKFRDRMVELNQEITWVPAHIKDGQFGKWLEGARDWSISRNRFWGSPIPVWTSDDPAYPRVDVYGSLDALQADFGVRPEDLHRPYVDQLTRPNPDDPTGRSTMRRVPEVLDCWFESGSMPYAQVHYPFENKEWFDGALDGSGGHYPGDFIVEYNGQTRGWFYTLHVLATALFDRKAFETCVAHGIVLGDDGAKMSKSRRNYPDVGEVFERDGSDAMRWFLMSSPILRGADLVVTEAGIRESVRQAVLPLWNAWYFLSLYGNAAGRAGTLRTDSPHQLDRYVLAKTAQLRDTLTAQLDVYDIAGACASVRSYLEVLTNWYVRRSRQRFWDGDADAIDTLHTVLETVTRLMAPLLPLTAEAIWRGLTGGRSVHLADWPAQTVGGAGVLPSDPALVAAMDEAREVASVALSLRKESGLRVRQPLAALTVALADPEQLREFTALLADEVNVREVQLTELAELDGRVSRRLTVNARAAGPRLGKGVQQVIKASKAGDWTLEADGTVTCGGIPLQDNEFSLELAATGNASEAVGVLRGGGFVSLDTQLDDDLLADGIVRDIARGVQDLRKKLGLEVSDRIRLEVGAADATVRAAAGGRESWLGEQVLAVEVIVTDVLTGEGADTAQLTVGTGLDAPVAVRVTRA